MKYVFVFMENHSIQIISNVVASRMFWRQSPVSNLMQKCVTVNSKQVSNYVRFGFVRFLGLFLILLLWKIFSLLSLLDYLAVNWVHLGFI